MSFFEVTDIRFPSIAFGGREWTYKFRFLGFGNVLPPTQFWHLKPEWQTPSSSIRSLFRSWWLDPMSTFTFQPVSKRPFTAQFWYQRNYKVYIIRRIGRTTGQGTNWSIVRERVKEVWRHGATVALLWYHRGTDTIPSRLARAAVMPCDSTWLATLVLQSAVCQ